jgi:KUP system potassium uptake protein
MSTHKNTSLMALAVSAMGVVFGDIGTSPLYTMNEVFFPGHGQGLAVTRDNVFGICSLAMWSLIIVVAIKYAIIILRADNQGEGGSLSLHSLAMRATQSPTVKRVLTLLAVFGIALFFADSAITPAMSLLSAAEGLIELSPKFEPFVMPFALVILLPLFYFQKFGTGKVSKLLGPIMVVWFAVLGILGIYHITTAPQILGAVNPWYALKFLWSHGWLSLIVMGSVVLAITGAEALYADMGHFGVKPIRAAWFYYVMPLLLLNYFGQGASLLLSPEKRHMFFTQVPDGWPQVLLIILATLAAIIASQAVISGAFSIARQAMQLGFAPRMSVVHTSHRTEGQIYLPGINWALCILVLIIVLTFRSSTNLGAAYGLAVTGAMFIDTVLLLAVARGLWKWSLPVTLFWGGLFLIVDTGYLVANAIKIPAGGWLPLVVGIALFGLMTTWSRGRSLLAAQRNSSSLPLEPMIEGLCADAKRVPGTAVFMTSTPDDMPAAMLHNLKHNKVLHERNVLLTVRFEDVPLIPREGRLEVTHLSKGFFRVIVRYGFMNTPNVPKALSHAEPMGLYFDMMDTSFYVSRETLVPTKSPALATWRQRAFVFMARNSQPATTFFRIPTNRVLELGAQVKI